MKTNLPHGEKRLSETDMKCPFCGAHYVHHDHGYRLWEEENRYQDRFPMWSECCDHRWEMVIEHWKGVTKLFYVRLSPEPKYEPLPNSIKELVG